MLMVSDCHMLGTSTFGSMGEDEASCAIHYTLSALHPLEVFQR